jgi:hypothetical protein
MRSCIHTQRSQLTTRSAGLVIGGLAALALAGVGVAGPNDSCGGVDAGSCYEANGSPGCDCSDCCEQVCAIDPYCCEVEWDETCAAIVEIGESVDDCPDRDCNGTPDSCELRFDCNGNEIEDAEDIASGFSNDLDGDGLPDECEGSLDVVFVLDTTSSKGGPNNLVLQIREDLLSEDSILRTTIDERSNGCVRFGLVTFKDYVKVEQVLSFDEATFLEACTRIETSGGWDYPEASDRALLEVLLEGKAINCAVDLEEPGCCIGDGLPESCDLPRVCLASEQRFDEPFREGTGRIVIHLTDYLPGGCDDFFDQTTDGVFAERIADLAGDTGTRVIAIADGGSANLYGQEYAERSDGAFLGRCFAGGIPVQAVADSLRSLDLGDDFELSCPADLNRDGDVNGGDLGLLLTSWGISGACLQGDIDGDGTVSGSDLGAILSQWGACN